MIDGKLIIGALIGAAVVYFFVPQRSARVATKKKP